MGNSPEQFRQPILAELDRWRTVIQTVNIRLEEQAGWRANGPSPPTAWRQPISPV